MTNYDVIVLGGGPGGYLASERAGQAKLKTLCIEDRYLGGTCLNEGCIPTKTLLQSAKTYAHALHGELYGIRVEKVSIDRGAVIDRKEKIIHTLVSGVGAALKASRVDVVNGRGVITGRSAEGVTVQVGQELYTGKNLIIATGSINAQPPIPGLKEALESGFVLTNRELLCQREAPNRLVVIGGGVIGLELAAYCQLTGTKVTVVEMLDHIAGPNDRDLVRVLHKNLERDGMLNERQSAILSYIMEHVEARNSDLLPLIGQCSPMWTHLERQGGTSGKGAIGSKGPGETQLETDRRLIHKKIDKLRSDLDDVRRVRSTQRQQRRKNEIPVVAIVGYTNAGKSTLLNQLTGASISANNRLFDTLDTTSRLLTVSDTLDVVLSDTVGFIRKLPHQLVEAFKATLEELEYADLLLHAKDTVLTLVDRRVTAQYFSYAIP